MKNPVIEAESLFYLNRVLMDELGLCEHQRSVFVTYVEHKFPPNRPWRPWVLRCILKYSSLERAIAINQEVMKISTANAGPDEPRLEKRNFSPERFDFTPLHS